MRHLGGQPYQDICIIVTYDSRPWDHLHLDTISHWIQGNLLRLTIYAKPEVPLGLKNYDNSTSKLLLAAFCAASSSEVLSLLTKIVDSYTLEMGKALLGSASPFLLPEKEYSQQSVFPATLSCLFLNIPCSKNTFRLSGFQSQVSCGSTSCSLTCFVWWQQLNYSLLPLKSMVKVLLASVGAFSGLWYG